MTTRKIAKNTFGEGLIMDFAPDNTLASVLTNALNATLLTFNGNEMSLQNDMGNGRVESAYLPEGFIPVGTCEFGDIIYIVSYNPLENKSLIGCFPSPERNISNTEISPLSQRIEGLELTHVSTSKNSIDGNPSVKKVVFGSKNLNSGDKFILSWGDTGSVNYEYISNYGNTSHNIKNKEDYWPKLTKIHVVAIEDNGSIVYLDDSVKWYDTSRTKLDKDGNPSESEVEHRNFIISEETFNTENPSANLDTYRNALQCQYSVFQAKTSGKLALLLELETINSFDCGYKVITRNANSEDEKYYDVYISTYWGTDNFNVNPCGFIVTESNTTGGLISCGNDNKFIVDPSEQFDCSRMIEYSRLYKLELPGDSYEEFKKYSYYEQVKDDTYPLNTNIINRAYQYHSSGDGSLEPEVNSENPLLGLYVFNAIATEENTGKLEYLDYKGILTPIAISDDVVVNYYHAPVLKKVGSFKVDPDRNSGIPTLEFTICPCMPYGPLLEYAVSQKIEFTDDQGNPELTTWKYYISGNSATLKFGINPHLGLTNDTGISKIIMEFYDSRGLCTSYLLNNQETYNSVFTEYINLNAPITNYRFNSVKYDDWGYSQDVYTAGGQVATAEEDYYTNTAYLYEIQEGKYAPAQNVNEGTPLYENQSNILFRGRPYLVKIKIYKGDITPGLNKIVGGSEKVTDTLRWMWTAPIFNTDYGAGTANDFNELDFKCTFDWNGYLDGRALSKNGVIKKLTYNNLEGLPREDFNPLTTLGAQVEAINLTTNAEILYGGFPSFTDSYGDTIFFNKGETKKCENLKKINVYTMIDGKEIRLSEQEILSSEEGSLKYLQLLPQIDTDTDLLKVLNNLGADLKKKLGLSGSSNTDELYKGNLDSSENYKDSFTLQITGGNSRPAVDFTYLDSKGTTIKKDSQPAYQCTAFNFITEGIKLSLKGIKFNKIMGTRISNVPVKELYPLSYNTEDLEGKFGLAINSLDFAYFKFIPYIGISEHGGSEAKLWAGYLDYSKNPSSPTLIRTDNIVASAEPTEIGNGTGSYNDTKICTEFEEISRRLLILPFPVNQIVFGRSSNSDNDKGYAFTSPVVNATIRLGYEDFEGNLPTKTDVTVGGKDIKIKYRSGTGFGGGRNVLGVGLPTKDGTFTTNGETNKYTNLFTCLALNVGGVFWPTGDIGVLSFCGVKGQEKAGRVQQEFNWRAKLDKANKDLYANYMPTTDWKSDYWPKSYAQIWASVLSLVYSLRNSDRSTVRLDAHSYLNNYLELWSANIVSKLDIPIQNRTTLNADATSNFVGIIPEYVTEDAKGCSLLDYVCLVLDNAKVLETDAAKCNNIEKRISLRNINPLLGPSTKCLEFNYNLDYDISKIESLYLPEVSEIVLHPGAVLNSKLKTLSEVRLSKNTNALEGVLYTYDGANLLEFSDSSTISYVYKFERLPEGRLVGVIEDSAQYMIPLLKGSGFQESLKETNGSLRLLEDSKLNPNMKVVIKHLTESADTFTIGGLHTNSIFNFINYGELQTGSPVKKLENN